VVKRTKNLRVHHDLPGINGQIGIVETPIEHLGGSRLIGGVVVGCEVLVRESLGSGDTGARVEYQHLLEQVKRERVGIGELGLEWDLLPLW